MAESVKIDIIANDKASGNLGRVGGALQNVANIAGGIVGAQLFTKIGTEIVDFVGGSITAASNLQESLSKIDVVFGENASAIEAWASQGASAFGMSKNHALEAAGTYGNLFSAIGLTDEQTMQFSQDMVELAGDLTSFNNIPIEDSLNMLRAGLVGEAEPLKRVGVLLDETTLKQKAFELGLISSTKEALTPAQKAQAAYAAIMEQTEKAQGDFNRTEENYANQKRILAENIEDASGALGDIMLPVLTDVMSFLNTTGVPILQGFITGFGDLYAKIADSDALAGVKDIFSGIFTTIRDMLSKIDFSLLTSKIKDMVVDFSSMFAGLDIGGMDGFLEIFMDLFSAVKPLMPLFGGFGGILMKSLMPALISLAQALAPLVAQVLPQLTEMFALAAGELVGMLIPPLLQLAESIMPILIDVFTMVIGAIMPLVNAVLPILIEMFGAVIEAIMPVISTVLPILVSLFGDLVAQVLPIVQQFLPQLLGLFGELVAALMPIVTVLLPPLVSLFGQIASAIFPLIAALMPIIVEWLRMFVVLITSLVDILLPPLVALLEWLADIIGNVVIPVVLEVANWLKNKLVPAFKSVSSMINAVVESLKRFAEWLGNIHIPDWLQPGSPTPFELGLRGINKELRAINRIMPEVNSGFNINSGVGVPAMVSQGATSTIRQNNYLLGTINLQMEGMAIDILSQR